ncbi:hypothetical protein [Spirosoma spitsbergense]|uniref:hypothetical protein n=1 Tax=Spirosoma spitsbergense TaxID=431554 RepID=UPI000363B080|nr:hypothetical protein [Spirosoma spitsbergense]
MNRTGGPVIQQDDRLKELFKWITSVPGVGPATATEVMVATDEFKAISDPKLDFSCLENTKCFSQAIEHD